MTTSQNEDPRAHAIVRAEAYRLMAVLLGQTAPDVLREEIHHASNGPHANLFGGMSEMVNDDVAYEHTRLFAQGVAVSPCETSYGRLDKGTTLGQLAALYGLFGVRSGGTESEAPDHICVELEFASLLCLKEAMAYENGDDEKVAISRRAQEVLLNEHLGAFAPRFVQRLVTTTDLPYFQAAGEVLARWLAKDLKQNGWSPERWAAHLPMVAEDFEQLECPVAPATEA